MPGAPLELSMGVNSAPKPNDEAAERWRSSGGAADESVRIGMPGCNAGVIVIQEGVEAGSRYGKPAGKPFQPPPCESTANLAQNAPTAAAATVYYLCKSNPGTW